MQTIKEYLINNHFVSHFEKLGELDCICINESNGAYMYITLPTFQTGKFKTDATGENKPIKIPVDEMGWNIQLPKPIETSVPNWNNNMLYKCRESFAKAFYAGKLNPLIDWIKKTTGDNKVILGIYNKPGEGYYVNLSDDRLQLYNSKYAKEGYCCLLNFKFKKL